jgi:hypothetical protein
MDSEDAMRESDPALTTVRNAIFSRENAAVNRHRTERFRVARQTKGET